MAAEGEAIAIIDIPAIGVRETVVSGTSRQSLRSGPGHYRSTAQLGHTGNAAIAGHRTTHGAPFFDLDRLQPGDEIRVETIGGDFVYRVEGQLDANGTRSGHRIVTPDAVEVLADRGDDRLTLTACHPRYSARQRIVVTAVLVGPAADHVHDFAAASLPLPSGPAEPTAPLGGTANEPAPAHTPPGNQATGHLPPADRAAVSTPPGNQATASTPPGRLAAGVGVAGGARPGEAAGPQHLADLGWQTAHGPLTARWGLTTAAIAAAAVTVGRRWRRLPAYAVVSPAFTLSLLTFFTHLDRLLPAS
jgi:sortase A